jgi:hypothetical protein
MAIAVEKAAGFVEQAKQRRGVGIAQVLVRIRK